MIDADSEIAETFNFSLSAPSGLTLAAIDNFDITVAASDQLAATSMDPALACGTPIGTPTCSPHGGTAKANCTLSNGNLTISFLNASNNGNGQGLALSVFSANSGKYYFEFTHNGNSNTCSNGNHDSLMVGVAAAAAPLRSLSPYNDMFLYYALDGSLVNNGVFGYGTGYVNGDVIGVALDLDNNAMWFSKNGVWQAGATISEIEAGTTTNAAFTGLTGTYHAAMGDAGEPGYSTGTANFGGSAMQFTVPTGYASGFGAIVP